MLGVNDSARVLFNFVEREVRATERRSSLSGSRIILKSSRNCATKSAVYKKKEPISISKFAHLKCLDFSKFETFRDDTGM